jgi:hypothetical protein
MGRSLVNTKKEKKKKKKEKLFSFFFSSLGKVATILNRPHLDFAKCASAQSA